MNLCCPCCGVWDVTIVGGESWRSPGGIEQEFCTGRCETCLSVILINPTVQAVETMAAQVRAARHVAAQASSGA